MTTVKVMGARAKNGNLDRLLAGVAALEKRYGAAIQLFRADRVFGVEHLQSAAEKAERSFSSGTNMAKTLGMEMLLYAAAERQTSLALKKLGLQDGFGEIAMVIIGEGDGSAILAELGLERDDSVLEPGGKDYSIFGITEAEAGMCGIQELVLEKVALSEIDR